MALAPAHPAYSCFPVADTVVNPAQLAAAIKERARELGFDLVGIASADPSRHRAFVRQWLDEGRAGSMRWLAERFEERTDVRVYVPGAASVVCVAVNYHSPLPPTDHSIDGSTDHSIDGSADHSTGQPARVARYALGTDYHELITSRLHQLADWLRGEVPGAVTRAAVDTAPVLERELAARAGIGWVGKNACIINPKAGSWLLLGEVITSIELPADQPVADRCGTCRRCIDACPTHAIPMPYQIDPRRCIAYLTVEHRGEIPAELRPGIGNWLYGCDICQEVCPWNTRAPVAGMIELLPRPALATGTLDADEVLCWTAVEYQHTLKGSAMKRAKLPMLQRNARIVIENAGGGKG